jgi:GNAT superfamily N-acetyltransferase
MRKMRIVQWDTSDENVTGGCHKVLRESFGADDPDGPPMSARRFRVLLEGSRSGNPNEVWYAAEPDGDEPAADGPGTVRGWYRLRLPDLENLDVAFVRLMVRPGHRRRGTGTALLRHAAARAAAHGRARLVGETLRGTAGEAFAARAGAAPGLTEARRVLNIARVPAGTIARMRESAAKAAAGYSLASWTGPTPDERLTAISRMYETMNDAPWDYEDERWDAQRVRERVDANLKRRGTTRYTVAAFHDGSGDIAAFTELEVDPEHPEWGFQGNTAVTRPHRGHRLGMLVKAAMLEWLAGTEPELRRIETCNADSNKHMIAINEQLGFEPHHPWWRSYELPVVTILG